MTILREEYCVLATHRHALGVQGPCFFSMVLCYFCHIFVFFCHGVVVCLFLLSGGYIRKHNTPNQIGGVDYVHSGVRFYVR